MKHLLIDFETVQPADLNGLDTHNITVWLLLGTQQQESLPLDLCESLCRFHGNVRFVRVQGEAALGAYLGFRLGALLTENPAAQVAVLSRNPVYEMLAAHVRQGLPAADITLCAELPALPAPFGQTAPAAVEQQQPEALPAPHESHAAAPEAVAEADAVLEKYYPVIVEAMKQKDAYHPKHRRNLATNIERYLSQYSEEIGADSTEMLAELVIVRLSAEGYVKDLGEGTLSYHFHGEE